MGVYEDLLKRKKIIEDEQGNVVSNNVVDKDIRRQLNDNNIQTYNIEETKSSINKMKNVIQNTATKTIWDRMQDVIISNKSIKPNNIIDSFRNNISNSINEELNPTNKNKNIIQDTGSLAKLVGLGASTGGKEVFNYIESANENNFNGYNDLRKRQFLTSQKVNEEDKAKAKTQDNLLLSSNGIKIADENRVETNLVKKAIRDSINKDNEKIQEEQSKMSNQATKKLAEIAPSMGQMLPGMALNAVNPILGTAYFTTSAGGGYIDDALNRGMNEQQAFKYGTVMGALEGASESIITGQQLSKVKKAFTGKAISKKLLNSYGFNIFENAVQEAVMEPAQEITAGIVGDKADWSNMGSRMLESGFNGALMGAISNGVTFGLEKSGNVYDKIKNGENITETEYKEALQENINKFGKNAVENAMKNGATEVYQEINNIQQQSTQSEQILPTQQINQEQNNVVQNENMEQILPTQKYYYEKSDNVKIDNLRQDVNKYFDNSEKTHNFVNMLEKIIEDKDINIRLDENLTDTNGNIANGKYENGTITINPNSDRAGEFIAIHELTHAIGTDSMRNIIENYRKSNTEFDNAVKSLLENYNTTELTDEAMADVSAQLLGNQEYINNLAQTNPSMFRKIYNEIKYLWHQFTGYKNQNQFIEDLQYKWEQAYRNNNKLNETSNYLKAKLNNGEDTVISEDVNGTNPTEAKARKTLESMLGIKYINEGNQKQISIENKDIGKFLHDGYNDYKSSRLKKRIAGNYGEVIEIAKEMPNKSKANYKGSNRGKQGYDYYTANLSYPIRDMNGNIQDYNHYTARLVVRKDNGGNFAYDLDNFDIKNGATLDKSSLSIASDKSDSGSFINNSIPLTQKNVNSDTTNYSMQESENNSGSFSLPKSVKEIKNMNEFLRKNIEIETDHVWKERLKDAQSSNYTRIDNRRTPLQYKREIVQQYLDYKNNQNTVSTITKDNKGRKLTKGQQEYFENEATEFKDEKGNIKTYYTGTNADFTIFDPNKIAIDNLGHGFYFTDNKDIAQSYAERRTEERGGKPRIIEAYIKSEKPFDMRNVTREQAVSYLNYDFYDPDNRIIQSLRTKEQAKTEAENLVKEFEEEQKENWGEKRVKHAEERGFIKNNNEYDYSMLISTSEKTFQKWLKKEGYDSIIVPGKDKRSGLEGVAVVVFNSNQIKNVDNLNPTDNPDIRYSKNNQNWQEYLDKNIEPKGTKTNLQDIKLPTKRKILPVKENNNIIKNPTKQSPIPPINNTQGEIINWNEIEKPEGKIRKHYRSIIESSNTTAEAKAIAKEMMGTDTYIPESNNSQIERADKYIENNGVEKALERLREHIENDEITYDNKGLLGSLTHKKVSVDDIALGERLIQYYSKIGDRANLQDAIHYTAIMGTEAGRAVQVMSLLNHMTPQGQLVWLDRSITKMNNELQQRYGNKENLPQFELTSEMTDKLLNTQSKEEMYKVLDEIYEELGQQVPKTTLEKIDEWRYFSMLANIKTHGRNMIGNLAMNLTQRAKNKVAGAIEGTVAKFNPEMERTHTIVPTSKKVKEFAKNDVKNMDVQTELGMNENKYIPQSRLQSARRTFKSDVLENTLGKMFDLNSKLLEVEDNIGLKSMYVKSLGEYITANKIDIDNMTDAQLSKARQHAIKEAQEATFHQASALATALNQMGRKNNIAKFALDSAIPFKKTPINVAKTGVQYSPVGLIKSAVYDVGKLRKGDITVNQYIDNISKGLTGTGIAYLGYALAQAGILKASGSDDDKKEKYEEEQGKQSYSIEIGGKTYSLDWLSPVGIPLFIGAEINQQFNTSKKEKNSKSNDDNETLNQIVQSVANIANASANAMNPMSEMSMISGLTSVLSSYNKENAVGDMIVNTGKSYINQFVPTALGQLARTTDDYERTTKSTKTGALEKAVDSTINQIKSKIPGLRQTLPTKTDIWGKDVKQSENLPFRAFNNFINPSKVQEVSTDKVDKELNSLYAKTGESSIIPKAIDKKYTIDGTDYRMTDKEYAKYYQKYGETSYNLINELISSKDYKNLTDEQKQKAIENVYSYAKESNKLDYAKNNNIEVKEKTIYTTMNELKDKGGKQSSYLNYIAKTTGLEKEVDKNKALANSNYDDKTKSIIYANGTGKDDKLYNNIKNSNININQYLTYKIEESEDKFLADKDSNGKSISGTAKEKVYNYVNNNITGYNNRLLLLGQKYKLSKSEQENLAKYIYQISTNSEEKNSLFEYYSKNFTIKNGKVYYK